MTSNTNTNDSRIWINSYIEQANEATGGSSDVFVEVVIDTEKAIGMESEYIPTVKEALCVLADEIKMRAGEYLTPFNILMVKLVAVAAAIIICLSSIIVGTVHVHKVNRQNSIENTAHVITSVGTDISSIAKEAMVDYASSKSADVLGKWFEFDPERDDIRTMTVSIDDNANCIYKMGGINGLFNYSDGILKLKDDKGNDFMTLNYEEKYLVNESNGIRYYRTSANIDSLKFAEFIKKKIPGTYQEFLGGYLYVYSNGKWIQHNPWVDDHQGTWNLEINEGCVSMIFNGMGIHFGGGNIYKVNSSEYETEKAEINSGDYSLRLDINNYERISGNLP